MKTSISNLLIEADQGQLYDIISSLCDKHKNLQDEIEFILNPREIKKSQAYYNKLVKRSIDTNSWSKFPDKGIKGLHKMLSQAHFLNKIGNSPESQKIAIAIQNIIQRCQKKYNNKNVEELLEIQNKIQQYLTLAQ